LKRWICLLLLAGSAALAAGSGGVNAPAQRDKPYLVLVSIDGFRWDYPDRYTTPTLDRIAARGIRAERLVPVFPTLTFPNFYSIATGLYPAHHGIIGNRFLSPDRDRYYSSYERDQVQDGSWYHGMPVWVAAEEAGMVTAAYFFVGTEAAIDDVELTYWNAFDASVPGEARVRQALEWLAMPADKRPHLVTLYFEDVDKASHEGGPEAPLTRNAVQRVDGYLADLMAGIDALPIADQVYVVVVSDHGQATRDLNTPPFVIDRVADLDDLFIVDHGTVAFIYFREPDPDRATAIRDAINATWKHGKAMLREEVPASWHAEAEAGFAELVVQADPRYLVYSTADRAAKSSLGEHGWAREFAAMHGIFFAAGPRLPKGRMLDAIEVVDVYPLLMAILGLPITTPVDGNPSPLVPLLGPAQSATGQAGL